MQDLSPTVGEENRLRILFEHKENEIICNGGDYIMRNFMICITHRILFG